MDDFSATKASSEKLGTVLKVCLGLSFILILVELSGGVVACFLKPQKYFSKVTIEVQPDLAATPEDSEFLNLPQTYDPHFVQTQFEIIRRTEILYPVIDRLDLNKEYAPPGGKISLREAYDRLKHSLDLREIRHSGFVEIGAEDTNPQRAANIANAIALIYQEKRRTDLEKNANRGLDELQDEVEKQRKKVEDASALATQLRARDGIVDSAPDKENSNIGFQRGEGLPAQQRLDEQRLKVVELERQLEMLNHLRPDELREALRVLNIDDPAVSKNVPLLQDAIIVEAKLTNFGFGVDHPRIKALELQKQAYSKILSNRLTSIRATQSDKLRAAKDTLNAVESADKDASAEDIEERAKMAEYLDAKNQQILSRKLLETMEASYGECHMTLAVKPPTAIIWKKAEKAEHPINPWFWLQWRLLH